MLISPKAAASVAALALLCCAGWRVPTAEAQQAQVAMGDYDALLSDQPAEETHWTIVPPQPPLDNPMAPPAEGPMASPADLAPTYDPEVQIAAAFCPTGGCCPEPCRACRQARLTGWSVIGGISSATVGHSNTSFTYAEESQLTGGQLKIAHESSRGGGYRVAFRSWDDEISIQGSAAPHLSSQANVTFSTFDFDLYQRVWVGDTSLVLGAGVRAAHQEVDFLNGSNPGFGGGGLSAFLEFRRSLYRSELSEVSVLGYGRYSQMLGTFEETTPGFQPTAAMGIAETGLGLEYRRRLGRGDLILQYMADAQLWSSSNLGDHALLGDSFMVGYQW
ncbi:hypothetical protein Mal64_18640 [Pseudobythopirellula maris]|uniref:Outer membrane protein beta-barrel domain-containing protein n=1 Tax=Pseudobythopirellula maris TaxID=2527991 RepID=A0A5C5ZLQ3_9BACT|nr:hypothetical protein [Pseudobythopirellula maris]TWT88384.1 hypothetical protein Mal64_18640 [Pseudobythopirellula maris]